MFFLGTTIMFLASLLVANSFVLPNPSLLPKNRYLSTPSSLFATYTVTLPLPPLGIVFEELPPYGMAGVKVASLVTSGAGEKVGSIGIGDRLLSTTAVKIASGTSKVQLVEVDCTKLDYDTVVSAIGSHQSKFGVDRVEMTFEKGSLELSESLESSGTTEE
mmetsp:Transcript_11645/g.23849  ORF Transcript_11645/g.23849 Transcript_11645/m.23849 type:complete len:161 (-) Transcript_11645:25-507(-)